MNDRSPLSFNTLKQSRRKERRARRQKARITLLGICVVIILLLLTLAIFLFCAIADALKDPKDESDTPPAISTPSKTTEILYSNTKLNQGVLLLVNLDHYYDPALAPDLVKIEGTQPAPDAYEVRNTSWKLNNTALSAFNDMIAAYRQDPKGNNDIQIASAYRTADDQKVYSTPVGHSDHHSGYCLAISDRSKTPLTDHWIYENGHKFGFIRRYPDEKSGTTNVSTGYEYCIRYVGIPHATYIYQNSLCLEEYVELLRTRYANGEHLQITDHNGTQYEVYYVAKSNAETTSITVPANYAYTISGDNANGFIVTVNLSTPLA